MYDAGERLRLWRAGFYEGVFMVLPRVFFVRSPLVCFGFFRRLCCLPLGLVPALFSRCCFCVFLEVKRAGASGAGAGECGGGAAA